MGLVENPFADMEEEDKMPLKKGEGKVILNIDVYKTMVTSLTRYSNPNIPTEQWLEVMGLLYGYNDGKDVVITEAVPFTHTKKEGHILKVQFDEADYALAADLETQLMTRDPPQFIVGWFHSHPGILVMLSQDDIKNQLAWQTNNPNAIALVFNHERLLKQIQEPQTKGDAPIPLDLDPGFKCFRLQNVTSGLQANYLEIDYEFSDFDIDDYFIRSAQEYCMWSAYALPPEEEFVTKYQNILEENIEKMKQIYKGTKNYIETLKRNEEEERIPGLLDEQIEESEAIVKQGNDLKKIVNMLKKFLEYKEKDVIVPKIDSVLQKWQIAEKILENLHNLKKQYE